MSRKILIVDDERATLSMLRQTLHAEAYLPVTAASGAEALLVAREQLPDLVLLDVMLPDTSGLDILRKLKEELPETPVVMMSGHSDFHTAVEATRRGALDFFEKPVSLERLLVTIEKALDYSNLRAANTRLRQELDDSAEMVGNSGVMARLREQIRKVGPTKGTVLITGENGSGKELVARAIHRLSPRSGQAFVRVNSAAIPENLIESELFGHEKGSFTGATARRTGKFELAHRGTIFLDEIGDMRTDMQAKLLRVLQEQEFERVGGSQLIRVDVRVIAATNREIKRDVEEGRFREDLYYRLNVVPLHVPPLRERGEDVAVLARHFLDVSARENGKGAMSLATDAIKALEAYAWPGNVRELRNVMERLVILTSHATLRKDDVEGLLDARGPAAASSSAVVFRGPIAEAVHEFEKLYILDCLRQNDGHMARTARDLGLERSHLYKKMRSYGLSREDAEDGSR